MYGFFLDLYEKLQNDQIKGPPINEKLKGSMRVLPYWDSSIGSFGLQDWDLTSFFSCVASPESVIFETESSRASRKDNTVNLSAKYQESQIKTHFLKENAFYHSKAVIETGYNLI